MSEEKLIVELTRSEALVLFELPARWDGENTTVPAAPLTFEDDAERWALNDFFRLLETVVVEVFSEDYGERLRSAKERISRGREWHR